MRANRNRERTRNARKCSRKFGAHPDLPHTGTAPAGEPPIESYRAAPAVFLARDHDSIWRCTVGSSRENVAQGAPSRNPAKDAKGTANCARGSEPPGGASTKAAHPRSGDARADSAWFVPQFLS